MLPPDCVRDFSLGSDYVEWLPRSAECRAVNDDRSADDVAEYSQGFCIPEFDIERLSRSDGIRYDFPQRSVLPRSRHHGFYFFTRACVLIVTEPATAGDQDLAERTAPIAVTRIIDHTGTHGSAPLARQAADRIYMTDRVEICKALGLESAPPARFRSLECKSLSMVSYHR